MKSKSIIAMAVAGTLWSLGAAANQPMITYNSAGYSVDGPSAAPEVPPSMTTVTSFDAVHGGYKGWGPMANFMGPSSTDESKPLAQLDEQREHQLHVAEVNSHREQVWVANAPLRSEYDNIGATRDQGRGGGGFSGR
ncbi:MAG TPA: hypothetical protein VED01_10905 [Burkholderiales bacterium]|nr:hypothetical protein [Burkholderiales bacterium]